MFTTLGWLTYLFLELFVVKNHVDYRSSLSRDKYVFPDWNTRKEFFQYTSGRFVVNEKEELRKREVVFDMNELAKVAADSVGARRCVEIRKTTDAWFNKAFLMIMNDGQEVIAQVQNPNAARAHYATASEVATMDFVRRVCDAPAPRVYAWNSSTQSHPVGAEYIIMEKAQGVPLSQVWHAMDLIQKRKVLLDLAVIQKQWLRITFPHYGSLYYAKDLPPSVASHYVQRGLVIQNSEFVVGPAAGNDWHCFGRAGLDIERGPWSSLSQYLRSIGERDAQATRHLDPPKQLVMLCGPGLYQPDSKEKLIALDQYQHIVDATIPRNKRIFDPYLWHDNLNENTIFIDPSAPGKITTIIGWQCCHILPLFRHEADPMIFNWDGLEPKNLDWTPIPELSGLSTEEVCAAVHNYELANSFIAWRKWMKALNPDLFEVVEFKRKMPHILLEFVDTISEFGEGYLQSLLVRLKDTWPTLTAVADKNWLRGSWIERYAAHKGPDGRTVTTWSLVDHVDYNVRKAALKKIKEQVIGQLAENEEERAEYERYWPFD